jgi:hypothetical protein
MRRRTRYALAFGLVLVLTVGIVGAGWALDNTSVSDVKRTSSQPYTNQLTALVTRNGDGSYHYLYTLVYSHSALSGKLVTFSIGNLGNLAFTNQTCSQTSLKSAASTTSVLWGSGTVTTGNTVTFSYDSRFSYGLVDATVSGGLPSNGQTLGMVPEPCSLLAVAFGLGGVLWTRLRRRG